MYLAQDTKRDRTITLKFLPLYLTKKETDKTRFLQEAQTAAALNHPHVCTTYEIHNEGGDSVYCHGVFGGKNIKCSKI